jgi:predicted MFS family arabinose efflux permease
LAGVGSLGRAREALEGRDFRRILAIRLVGQCGDGLLLAALTASTVFDTSGHQTTTGFFLSTLIVSLPFSVLGPFVGVFIDRWSRRRILSIAPIVKALPVALVLANPSRDPVPFFAGALVVISVNRFFLATAGAVLPRVVPTEDLLAANSLATVGGTVALLAGVFAGGWAADLFGNPPVVLAAGAMWLVASVIASRITTPLRPHHPPEAPVGADLRRVSRELADGLRHLIHTPRAIGPIASISLDQMGQGVVLVLSLVVFRDRFRQGVGSFSNLIGAGGVGVLLGILTVGGLEQRFAKDRIVSGAFLLGGCVLIAVSTHITGWSVLIASFGIGLAFAWKKVPVDTLVQGAIPDGYRGRVFAVYDVLYNVSRVVAGFAAVPLIPRLGPAGIVALVGLVFLAYAPALPAWIRRSPAIVVRFYEGGRAEEWPRAVVWGDVEERVDVLRSWIDERDGRRTSRFLLRLEDGTLLETSKAEGEREWTMEREVSD